MKQFAPAAERNRDPILEVLRAVLPPRGLVLEIGCGTGQHAAHFAAALPQLDWQPTDRAPLVDSVAAWAAEAGAVNVRPALALDAAAAVWPVDAADAVYCANVIHISPWATAQGLFAGAARRLPPHAPIVLYGPFRFAGRFLADSNAAFDASLRARDASWGVRDLDDVKALAAEHGFAFDRLVERPANNHVVVFRRDAA
ncbi:MAG: DUF938 domain-containing protein [Myxococcales bacterium]|nr:DUF938 domain-containing protein [Myxococcales bacterium]